MFNLTQLIILAIITLLLFILVQNNMNIDNFFISIVLNIFLFALLLTISSLNILNYIFITFFFLIISFDLILIFLYIYNKFSLTSLKLILMLKFKKKKHKSRFTKKNLQIKNFKPRSGLLFSKNKSQFQIKIIVNILRRIKKRFKKRKLLLYIYLVNNFIRSYKSKNSRMGKGKGSLRKFSIRHNSRMIGVTRMSITCKTVFMKKVKYLYLS